MRKLLSILLAALLAVLLVFPACAGYNPLTVATDGEGIPVYASPASRKRIGMLFNGFEDELSLEATNGRFSCDLTPDTEVWLDAEKAMARLPGQAGSPGSSSEGLVPCSCYLAEIAEDRVEVYSGTGHKRVLAEHLKGTLVLVCGDFGSDWFISCCGYGFVTKSAVKKVKDLTYIEAGTPGYGLAWQTGSEIFLDGHRVFLFSSPAGTDAYGIVCSIRFGDDALILRDLGDWAQVVLNSGPDGTYQYMGFLEKRYLDPEADHSVTLAVVRTDHPLNRLIVREEADQDSWYSDKLCSGVRVQVLGSAGGWSEINLYGSGPNADHIHGYVMSKYLVPEADAGDVQSGCTRVRLRWDYVHGSRLEAGLTAGTEATVIGVSADSNTFILQMDDGRLTSVEDDQPEPLLEPVTSQVWKAKTNKKIALRTGPSTDAQKIRTLNSGASIEVLLRGEQWALVRYKGQTGYILSNALKPVK